MHISSNSQLALLKYNTTRTRKPSLITLLLLYFRSGEGLVAKKSVWCGAWRGASSHDVVTHSLVFFTADDAETGVHKPSGTNVKLPVAGSELGNNSALAGDGESHFEFPEKKKLCTVWSRITGRSVWCFVVLSELSQFRVFIEILFHRANVEVSWCIKMLGSGVRTSCVAARWEEAGEKVGGCRKIRC